MVIESDVPPANPIVDFEDFFKTFEDAPNDFKYRRKISESFSKSENHIVILFEDVLNFNPVLANYLRANPEQALKDATESFKNILRIDSGGLFDANKEYFVRISTLNNSNEVKLREIRSKHIDQLIYVKGIIIRSTAVKPQITIAAFECPACGNIMQETQIMGKLKMPRACSNPNCNNNKDFRINTDNSIFIDHQIVTVQESPEELRAGAIPQTLTSILLNDLVDNVRPGERVKIMGIYKTFPQEDGKGHMSTVFKTQLMVNYIEGMQQNEDEVDLTPKDLEEIISLSIEPLIQNKRTIYSLRFRCSSV
jgi:replicative DNA helicase Mcm